jgi:hypothetical protein
VHLNPYLRVFLLLACSAAFASCVQLGSDTTGTDDTINGPRTASFKANGKLYSFDKPYMSIFEDNGIIRNWVTLEANDGSKLDLHWTGTSTGTYELKGYSTGSWDSPSSEHFNPISGQIVITSYSANPDAVLKVATGTFHFAGESIDNSSHTVEITDGVLTNASNRVD